MRAKQALTIGSRTARLRTGTPVIAGLATGTCTASNGYTANSAFVGSTQMCLALWFRLTGIRTQSSPCNIVGTGTSTTGWSIGAYCPSNTQCYVSLRLATSSAAQYAVSILTSADIGNVHVVGFQVSSTGVATYQKKRQYSSLTRSGTYAPSSTSTLVMGKGVAWDGVYTSSAFYGMTVFGFSIATVTGWPVWSDYFDSIFQTNKMQPFPNATSAATTSHWSLPALFTAPVTASASITDSSANGRTFTASGSNIQATQFDALKRAKYYYGFISAYYAYAPGTNSVVNAVYRSSGGICAGGAGAGGFWVAIRYWSSPNTNPNAPTYDVLTCNRTVETTGTTNGWGCYRLNSNGNFSFYVGNASRSIPAPGEGINVAVGVFSGSTITAYVNGYTSLAAVAATLTSPGTNQQFGSTLSYSGDSVILEVAGGHYSLDAATVLNQWADTQAKGTLAPISGYTNFYWSFSDGVRSTDGQYLPTVVRDHYSGHDATLTYPDMTFTATPQGYSLLTGASYDPQFHSVSALYGATSGFWAGACFSIVSLPTSTTSGAYIFSTSTKGSNLTSSGGWGIYVDYAAGVSVSIYAEAYANSSGTLITLGPYTVTTTGSWYAVVLNYDGATYTLNVNGTAVATATGTYMPAPSYCVPAQLMDRYTYTIQLGGVAGGHVALTAGEIAAQSAASLDRYDMVPVTDKTRDHWSITASMSSEATPSFQGVITNTVGANPMCSVRPCQTAMLPEGNWAYNEPTTRLVGLTGYASTSTAGSYITNSYKNSVIGSIRGFWFAMLVGVKTTGNIAGYFAQQTGPIPWHIYRNTGAGYTIGLGGTSVTTTTVPDIGGTRLSCVIINYKGTGITNNVEVSINGALTYGSVNISSLSSWSNLYINSSAAGSVPSSNYVFFGAACGAVPLARSDMWYLQRGIQVANDIVAVPGKTTSLWSVKQSLTDTSSPPAVLRDQIGEDHATAVSLSGISLYNLDFQDFAW